MDLSEEGKQKKLTWSQVVKIFKSLKICNVSNSVMCIPYIKKRYYKGIQDPKHKINVKERSLLFLYLYLSWSRSGKHSFWQYLKGMIIMHLVDEWIVLKTLGNLG